MRIARPNASNDAVGCAFFEDTKYSESKLFVATKTNMMKCGTLSVWAMVLNAMLLLAVTMVQGEEIAHVVIFHDNVPDEDLSCDDAEWDAIRNAMIEAAQGSTGGNGPEKRRLGGKGSGTGTTALNSRRRAQGMCSNCGPYCGSSGQGCPGGMGRRRRRERRARVWASQTAPKNKSPLQVCQDQIPAVDAALADLALEMSTNCRSLMESSRDITCRTFTMDCDVSFVSLVEPPPVSRMENLDDSPTPDDEVIVPKLKPSGDSFCESQEVTFLASTEFDYGTVTFTVAGETNDYASEHTVDQAPYYMDGADGKFYPSGDYTIAIASQYDPADVQIIDFRVDDC
jgi:hypothetical protein